MITREELKQQIIKAVPWNGKGRIGQDWLAVLDDILNYDTATTILIQKAGVENFVKFLRQPQAEFAYNYEKEWRHSIWNAAMEGWREKRGEAAI